MYRVDKVIRLRIAKLPDWINKDEQIRQASLVHPEKQAEYVTWIERIADNA